MSFQHGITTKETATSLVAIKVDSITPTYVGTAPINLGNIKNVNEPILCYSYEEAVAEFGFVKDFENYTLCEAIDAHFSKFGTAPIVLINVLDPETNKKNVTQESVPIGEDNTILIKELGILKDTITLNPPKEFTAEFDDDGNVLLVITDSEIPEDRNVQITFDKLDPSTVESDAIIGGIDGLTGKKKGLECISLVFPKYRLVPNPILAPKFSTDSTVAAVMETKASLINGHFKAIALVDIDTTTVTKYSDAVSNKNTNNINSTYIDVSYPKVALGDTQYHLSTQKACIIQKLAFENDSIPYKSPSNESLKADRTCLANGTDILLGIDEANYLNGNGINTAINWINGWVAWGNRASCYPGNTDPKDCFIASRMMFNFLTNSIVQTFWQKVDDPTNTNLINTIKNNINIWLNGLQAAGKIIGGRIEFRAEDNPLTSLIDGKIKFKIYFSPALPAEEIAFDLEIDTEYYNSLF